MKYLSNLIPILSAFLLTWTVLPMQVQAQQGVDGNRLNRDINIMESVLSEMFRMRSTGTSSQARVVTAFSSRSDGVRGTYLPDYGLIFQIDRPSTNFMVVNSDEDTESNMVFQYGETESGEQEAVTRESVTSRIVEFLQDYGSTIGQLADDEHVMVIYGGTPGSKWPGGSYVFSTSGNRVSAQSADRLPVISVSARMSDLSAYRRGDLNDQQFRSRVSVSETEPNDAGSKDMRVMANIFETAFEGGDEASFRIRGSADYLQLDNFGALFFFEAGYGSSGSVFRVQGVPRLLAGSDSNSSRVVALEEMRKTLEEQREEVEQKREETRQKTVAAYETFKTELREYLVDYGRTLSSVDTDQHVLLSITLNSSVEDIPDRIDVQVSKSVLERMDRGNLSREEAISQVSLREY